MTHLISISENISPPQRIGDRGEVFATAEASFDRKSSRLQVKLESFAWRPGFDVDGNQPPVDWLPQPKTLTKSVSQEEATHVAKEIFNKWAREVRKKVEEPPEKTFDEGAASLGDGSRSREVEFSTGRNFE